MIAGFKHYVLIHVLATEHIMPIETNSLAPAKHINLLLVSKISYAARFAERFENSSGRYQLILAGMSG